MHGLEWWAHRGHPSMRDSWQRNGTLPAQDTMIHCKYLEHYKYPWFSGNMPDCNLRSQRSEFKPHASYPICFNTFITCD